MTRPDDAGTDAGPADAAGGVQAGRLAELWQRWDEQPRPIKEGLSVHRITEAAVAIADAEGLAAVSMAKVAKRLGYTPMALYRHVASKDELLLLMVNSAMEPFPAIPPGLPWRAGLEAWIAHIERNVSRSPWSVDVNPTGLNTPAQWAALEAGLQILAPTGLPDEEKAAVLLVLSGLVFNHVRTLTQLADTDAAESFGLMFSDPAFAQRYPEVGRAVADGMFDEPPTAPGTDPPEPIDLYYGLRLMLDGLAARIADLDAVRDQR